MYSSSHYIRNCLIVSWVILGGAPIGIPALPPKPEYGAIVPPTRARAITSGSDVSEDEESELGQNVQPGDIKRVKR